jgi:hypothetical protein
METRNAETPEQRRRRALKERAQQRLWIGAGIAVAVAVLLVVALPSWLRRRKAKHDVDTLAFAMTGFAYENKRFPEGTPAELAAILQGGDIGGQNPKGLDYIVADIGEKNDKGEFVDPWRTPYRIFVDKEARAYSCGPNREDEKGDGDDVASWK